MPLSCHHDLLRVCPFACHEPHEVHPGRNREAGCVLTRPHDLTRPWTKFTTIETRHFPSCTIVHRDLHIQPARQYERDHYPRIRWVGV